MWEKMEKVMEMINSKTYARKEYGLTPKQMLVLLYIADKKIVTKKEIEADLDMEISTACKILQRLSNGRHNAIRSFIGLHLVEYYRDEKDRRRCVCRLTDKGRDFVARYFSM